MSLDEVRALLAHMNEEDRRVVLQLLREEHRITIHPIEEDWKTTAEAILEAADVPCSRLFDIADCAADPHFRARQSVQDINDPLIGWNGLLISVVLGLAGAVGQLLIFYRPPAKQAG